MPTVIEQAVQARLIAHPGNSRAISTHLRYEPADPFAVRIAFPAAASLDGADVEWTFARDLLASGLYGPTGDGNVHVWGCGPEHTIVEFHADEGMAMVRFDSHDLRRFLTRSYRLVPKGSEERHLDVDAELAALLREA